MLVLSGASQVVGQVREVQSLPRQLVRAVTQELYSAVSDEGVAASLGAPLFEFFAGLWVSRPGHHDRGREGRAIRVTVPPPRTRPIRDYGVRALTSLTPVGQALPPGGRIRPATQLRGDRAHAMTPWATMARTWSQIQSAWQRSGLHQHASASFSPARTRSARAATAR